MKTEAYATQMDAARKGIITDELKAVCLLYTSQLVYRDNKRFIEGIKYVYTPKGKLKMYKKILKILNTITG